MGEIARLLEAMRAASNAFINIASSDAHATEEFKTAFEAASSAEAEFLAAGGTMNVIVCSTEHALFLQQRHVCSACWGNLTGRPGKERNSIVRCSTPGCEFPGTVSRTWVERQIAEDVSRAREARNAFYIAGLWGKVETAQDPQKILKELGYE